MAREVDIFKKYSKNNKLKTLLIAIGIALVLFVVIFVGVRVIVPCRITFETLGGTMVKEQEYKFLQQTTKPDEPRKFGYYLEKWSTKEDLSDEYSFGSKIWRDIKLYADWRPGVAVELNFADGEENSDLSLEQLKQEYELYLKPGTSGELPVVYNTNANSYHYGERLLWFDNPECDGLPLTSKTYYDMTDNVQVYGKWFDVDVSKYTIDNNGVLQRYNGYCRNLILPEGTLGIKNIVPQNFIVGSDQLHEINASNASVFRNVIGSLKSIYVNPEMVSVGDCAFRSCEKLEVVEFLGDNVEYIGKYAFTNTDIVEINIPDKVQKISEYCFYNADSLTSINFGNGVKEIESSAFENCYSLRDVVLPASIELIYSRAFASCVHMLNLIINSDNLININLGINEEQLKGQGLSDAQIQKLIRENNILFNTAGVSADVNKLSIFVNEELLSVYKSAYGWNMYADYIKSK